MEPPLLIPTGNQQWACKEHIGNTQKNIYTALEPYLQEAEIIRCGVDQHTDFKQLPEMQWVRHEDTEHVYAWEKFQMNF